MPATLIGTVGVWGIAADETGMIIDKLDDNSRNEKNYMKDRVGCRVGRSDYDESMEITIGGKITATSPWSQKISGELTITNTISSGYLQTSNTGQTLIDDVQRSRANEDWIKIEVKAEMLPFFPES
jgi:hypothetical protein